MCFLRGIHYYSLGFDRKMERGIVSDLNLDVVEKQAKIVVKNTLTVNCKMVACKCSEYY